MSYKPVTVFADGDVVELDIQPHGTWKITFVHEFFQGGSIAPSRVYTITPHSDPDSYTMQVAGDVLRHQVDKLFTDAVAQGRRRDPIR
jgi:hypothetical protein